GRDDPWIATARSAGALPRGYPAQFPGFIPAAARLLPSFDPSLVASETRVKGRAGTSCALCMPPGRARRASVARSHASAAVNETLEEPRRRREEMTNDFKSLG